ncbi:DUF5954 family protein [Actinomadura parmotrematis]|uniref:PE-PGRS family protein n=1 Tax=Actinomadura parmotrematis TaxID=2864039 RepID=A0ABS7FMS0_9ACTN|nr:DUF5954 family protein [Actinomadura parmotrematis]MBW8480882.1 hypothetical protein [Actinomadura parmotrematis]
MTTGDGDAGGRLFPEGLDGVDPVAAVVLADAVRSIAAHPDLVAVGTLFTAAERVGDGWQVRCGADPIPQGARELLADLLAERAAAAGPLAARGLRAAAHAVVDGGLDEVRAAGGVFRIVRVEQLIRSGPGGPEAPRPTDPDVRPRPDRPAPPRPYDLIRPVPDAPDGTTSELLCQLLDAAARAGSEASERFLTPVPLTPAFTIAERQAGRWRPAGRLHDTPAQARAALASYLRTVVPAVERPGPAELPAYRRAAARMADGTRRAGVEVAGRRFRIVRIERITLLGPDGPEPPRPGDFDAR